MLGIKDAVAVITGGSGGIGMALAQYWAARQGKLVLADVAEDVLAGAKEKLGGDVVTVVCDVTREEDCAALADTAIKAFGRINLVAPFAGIIMDGLMVSTDRETGKVNRKMPLKTFGNVQKVWHGT
jgi:3-oxoacyl-[acyl-carrier protein] reductase